MKQEIKKITGIWNASAWSPREYDNLDRKEND